MWWFLREHYAGNWCAMDILPWGVPSAIGWVIFILDAMRWIR